MATNWDGYIFLPVLVFPNVLDKAREAHKRIGAFRSHSSVACVTDVNKPRLRFATRAIHLVAPARVLLCHAHQSIRKFRPLLSFNVDLTGLLCLHCSFSS